MYWDFELESTVRAVRERRALFDDSAVIAAFGMVDPHPDCEPVAATKLAEHQASLPRLPVPTLEETCELYLRSLQGLVNAEEHAAAVELAEQFLQPGSNARELHRLLCERASEVEKRASWLEEFWDDAYLVTRDPIPINVNYFFGFHAHPSGDRVTQVGRAASLLHAAMEVHVQIRDGTLKPDYERTTPLCMSQFRRVFATSRVPGRDRDSIVCYSAAPLTPQERLSQTCLYQAVAPRHCIVLARNRVYQVNVLSDAGDVLPLERLVAAVAEVWRRATDGNAPPGPPVGVLTTMERSAWAASYEQLCELGNRDVLQHIQSALMVLCLDSIVVTDPTEMARLLLHGTGTNRWFDRHNLIVTRNGEAGLNLEHSVGDGTTTLRVADYMYRQDARRTVDAAAVEAAVRAHGDTAGALVRELRWRLDSSVDRTMKAAFDGFMERISCNETCTLRFAEFGGNFVKSRRLSPDAFVQLALQLTYYRLFGRLDATYEAASTRTFLHGRTETVRSVTRAAADFCRAARDPIFSRRVGSVIPETAELLRSACDVHVEYMRRAKAARGVDRHLFGLRMMAIQHQLPVPELLTHATYAKSVHWSMSTSHCGSTALSAFGFGPVVPDGFGVGYMIFNDTIQFVVTSKFTNRLTSSTIFSNVLASSLLEMRAILDAAHDQKRISQPATQQFSHPTAFYDFDFEPGVGFRYNSRGRRSLYSHPSATSVSSTDILLAAS